MSDAALILHHYPMSPFSEKVRLVLGAKRLAWQSVHIPVVLPKPDLVALTGGYRRTPVLQVGADVYCDTALICKVLDAQAPEPALYPAGSAGTAQLLAQWADTTLFWAAAPYALQPAGLPFLFGGVPPEAVKAFGADRATMNPNFKRPTLPDAAAALGSYLDWLEEHLAHGRDFLVAGTLSIADFSVAHCLWFLRQSGPPGAVLDGRPRLAGWLDRMLAFGSGRETRMTSGEAVEIAAAARSHAPVAVEPGLGFEAGEPVTVMPTDYAHDLVAGTLVGLTRERVSIARDDARAGRVHVHFPRIAFQIKTQDASKP